MAGVFTRPSPVLLSQWPEPNYIDPVTRSWFPALSVTLTVVATATLATRFWMISKKCATNIGLDGLFVCSAWIFGLLFTTSCLLGTLRYGFDKHLWDVDTSLRGHAALIQWLSEGAFILTTCMTKMSVLCFYRRLDPPCSRAFQRIIIAFISLTALYSIGCLLTQLLLCRPISAYWTALKPGVKAARSCSSSRNYYLFQGSFDSFSMLYSIAIPFLVLRNIPMSRSQRTALRVISIFSLSLPAAGITRTVFLYRLAESKNGDATWNGFNVFVCAQLESQLALILVSLPFLYGWFTRDPSRPIAFYVDKRKQDSVMSRVSSSLSGQIRRIPFARNNGARNLEISRPRPQAMEIPDWEFGTLESPRQARSPVEEITYEQYVMGKFGPPAPPKDSRQLFDEYRREHGEIV